MNIDIIFVNIKKIYIHLLTKNAKLDDFSPYSISWVIFNKKFILTKLYVKD